MAADPGLWTKIKNAAIERIKSLHIAEIDQNVLSLIDIEADPANVEYPCLVAITAGFREEPIGGDTEFRHTSYPVGLLLVWRGTVKEEQLEPVILDARKKVFDAFHDKRLPGVTEVFGCKIQPEMAFDRKDSRFEFVRTSLVLIAKAREPR